MKKGKLYLIPTVISEGTEEAVITPQVREVISNLDYFLVENVRTARRYISRLNLGLTIEDLRFELLDKKTSEREIRKLLEPIKSGKDVGVMSESGCPGIADPGSVAVKIAHQLGAQVVPLSGPSSIFMALMGSGFNGQSFVFHGYVPIDAKERAQKIKEMERDALKKNQTQIFMDTPYRNQKLFEDLLNNCSGSTQLSVARDITGAQEYIQTLTIVEWKKERPDLHKVPVIFSLFH